MPGPPPTARRTPRRTGAGIELVLLAFAAVLVTLALVLVEANQEQTLTQSLLWVGLAYLALFTLAHLAVRRFAPYADPLILPCVALLNGLGLVMIHRLDLANAERAAALGGECRTVLVGRQIAWTAIGLALFIAVLFFVRDHRTLARYGYTAGFAGLVLLALPGLLPSSISEVNGAKIWLRLGIFSIQPGEFAKILLIVFFAAFLVQKRELFTSAGRRFLGMEFPRARDLAPLLVAWAFAHRRAGAGERPRHLAAVLRHRARDALRGHRTGVVDGHRAHRVRRRRAGGLPAVRPRPGARAGVARPVRRLQRRGLPDRRRRCSASAPAAWAAPASARAARTSCRTPRATSCCPRSARSWA